MGWHRYDRYERFPTSKPREAKGGIKAQSKRGTFGESWWAKRWIAVLESFNIGARLQRGRSYARKGQVLSIDVGEGTIAAKVQGSRSQPYKVAIKVKTLSQAEWKKLAGVLSQQAIFAAKLLAGEMPQDIEDAFRQAKLSLFPEKSRDLATDCSCPDWSNPCKHIAAVYYLLGEEFDRDPFLIFRLRGLEREELVRLIGGAPAARPASSDPDLPKTGAKKRGRKKSKATAESQAEAAVQDEPPQPVEAESAAVEPLPEDPKAFWGEDSATEFVWGEVRIPPLAAALPRRLGSLSFWRAKENFLDALEPIYRAAAPAGLDVFLGQSGAGESTSGSRIILPRPVS